MKFLFLWFCLLCFQPFRTAANDFTPLIEAVQKKDTSPYAIDALIKKGGYVNEKDAQGRTVLMLAAIYHPVNLVHYLLIQGGADVNAKTPDTGQTALFFAAQYNTPQVVIMLLNKGADQNIKDVFGRTAYDYAKRNPKMKNSPALWFFNAYDGNYDEEEEEDKEASSVSERSL